MQDQYRQPAWATVWKCLSGLVCAIGVVVVATCGFSFPGRWLVFLGGVLQLFIVSIWLTLFNNVIVCKSGLRIKMFQFFWIPISWNHVIGITDLSKTPRIYRSVGSFFWQRGGGGTWKLLQIQKLPWPYHLACWIGVGDVWAGILLPPQMFARDALEVKVRKGIEAVKQE